MAAFRISEVPVVVRPFDVTAVLGDSQHLFTHAMICVEAETRTDVTSNTELEHFHMRPPLETYRTYIHAVGSANLTLDENRQVKAFVDDRRSEKDAEDERCRILGARTPCQYWLMPDSVPPSASLSIWKFSCVGFVRQSYREAGIELLADALPVRTVEELKCFYPDPDQTRILENPALRERITGLIGDGPWPVSLVGYLLHAFDRPDDEIHGKDSHPYRPKLSDSHFPSSVR